jgi:hypothetical protein
VLFQPCLVSVAAEYRAQLSFEELSEVELERLQREDFSFDVNRIRINVVWYVLVQFRDNLRLDAIVLVPPNEPWNHTEHRTGKTSK